ncbi:MAG: phosphofructokinase, partial [Chloroflexi bacterium]
MTEARLPAFLDKAERARLAAADDVYDLTPIVLRNIASLGLDYLVTIGGDDTLSYSERLVSEGIPLIAVPKTM